MPSPWIFSARSCRLLRRRWSSRRGFPSAGRVLRTIRLLSWESTASANQGRIRRSPSTWGSPRLPWRNGSGPAGKLSAPRCRPLPRDFRAVFCGSPREPPDVLRRLDPPGNRLTLGDHAIPELSKGLGHGPLPRKALLPCQPCQELADLRRARAQLHRPDVGLIALQDRRLRLQPLEKRREMSRRAGEPAQPVVDNPIRRFLLIREEAGDHDGAALQECLEYLVGPRLPHDHVRGRGVVCEVRHVPPYLDLDRSRAAPGQGFDVCLQFLVPPADDHRLQGDPAFHEYRDELLHRSDTLGAEEEEHGEGLLCESQEPAKRGGALGAQGEARLDRELEELHLLPRDALFHDLVPRFPGEHHAPVEHGGEPDVVRIEGFGVEHDGDGVQLPHPLQHFQVVRESEIRRNDEVGFLPVQVTDEPREDRDAEDAVDDLHQERVVGPPVERVDQGRVPQRLVPVELVEVAQEGGGKGDPEVHDPHVEILVPEDVELLLDRLRGGDMSSADVDGEDVDAPPTCFGGLRAPPYRGGFRAPTYCGGFRSPPSFAGYALHQTRSVAFGTARCQ